MVSFVEDFIASIDHILGFYSEKAVLVSEQMQVLCLLNLQKELVAIDGHNLASLPIKGTLLDWLYNLAQTDRIVELVSHSGMFANFSPSDTSRFKGNFSRNFSKLYELGSI